MAFVQLPISADTPNQSFTVLLQGKVYGVHLRYNSRAGFWALDLFDAAGTPLIVGLAVRLGVDLLAQYADDRFPSGRLFIMNFVDEYQAPGLSNFGSDVVMIYQEAEA